MGVGDPGVRDPRGAAERRGLRNADLLQPPVDLGVDTADEEGSHRPDPADLVAARCAASSPSRNASRTSSYRAKEKIRVTFTLIPSARQAVTAGMLRLVAGILMYRLGRPTSRHSTRACVMVASVSSASRGSTSIETRPSTPPVASYTGRSTSS